MNSKFQALYHADITRYGNPKMSKSLKAFHFFFRKAQTAKSKLVKRVYRVCFSLSRRKYGIELSADTKIGAGLYLGHPYYITINPRAEIGENVNIHKGVTIGQENRGLRKGVPKIGNCVWIGINAVIVGNIVVGNDVLIAPNTFVNCDIPDHSVVFGNPCIIKSKEYATEGYINNILTENS